MRLIIASILVMAVLAVGATPHQPYAGHETRHIKSLSTAEIERLEKGEGMGMALAAELNHYPGPRHVLELADDLELSDAQRELTQSVFDEMHTEAANLGKSLVKAEGRLDQAFASQAIDADGLVDLLNEIGQIQTRIRYTHLEAHIRQRRLLEPAQIEKYDELRGYGSTTMDHSRHH